MKKIDMHCHLIPGADDGAASEQESLRMIQMAAKQGTKAVIATSHYAKEFPNSRPDYIRYMCRKMEEAASEKLGREFHVYPGQEIFYRDDVIEKLKRKEILTLADSDYILVEFLPEIPYSNLYRIVRDLVMARYKPILAHIERYGCLRENGRVEELIDEGACMQMNYRRIGGKWYEETTRWCRKMLKEENIHFLGTDMHNTKDRKPDTLEAEIWMEKHLDKEYIREICYKNVLEIIKSKNGGEKEE